MSNKFESILAKTFLIIITITITFTIAEFISRVLRPDNNPAGEVVQYDLHNKPHPYTMFMPRYNPFFGNPDGYRGKLPPKGKNGNYRIIFIGGSTTFLGEPPIPDLLQTELQKNNKKVEVINFGVPSAKSGEELARFVFEAIDYNPDLVIFYDGANDIFEPCGDPRPGYPFNFLAYERNPIMEKDVSKYPTIAVTAYGSNLLRILLKPYFQEKFLEINSMKTKYSPDTTIVQKSKIYINNIKKAIAVAKGTGIKFLAFFQPIKPYQNYFKERKTTSYDGTSGESPELWARQTIVNNLKTSPHFVDLTNFYNSYPASIYIDQVHTTQEAKHPIVLKISQEIINRFTF